MSCKLPLTKYYGEEIKDAMGAASGTGGKRNAHRALVGKILSYQNVS